MQLNYKYRLERQIQCLNLVCPLRYLTLLEHEDISWDVKGLFVKIHHLHRQLCLRSQLVV